MGPKKGGCPPGLAAYCRLSLLCAFLGGDGTHRVEGDRVEDREGGLRIRGHEAGGSRRLSHSRFGDRAARVLVRAVVERSGQSEQLRDQYLGDSYVRPYLLHTLPSPVSSTFLPSISFPYPLHKRRHTN